MTKGKNKQINYVAMLETVFKLKSVLGELLNAQVILKNANG